ncbi:hypothetical protein ERJ75_000336900 [Trypanosoma vivax]|uniref:Uncharacterized protein n=1 Tax=Trypanosoma vivax (strain Y486) TaxID=1055687 RepID=F9WM75_TRYVY|nr:hypothetical protein ERJ75_000336900 [Trypanosoma vivax]CCD18626.1 hypothetical protein, conserved [Trypanosoma vivax Y486]|eukprot:CCD18626.1 hypothetical protein, conserved [Trypanosoma vivax Y486]
MLRCIWDLMLHIVRLRVSVNFQFVFSHCGVPRNEAADKAAEQGNVKPQSHPAWITDIVAGVERKVRNEMCRAFEEGRMPRTHRSALLDHVGPAPKHAKVDRLGESLLVQFKTGTSKHFGWLDRVLTRKTDQLECRWFSAKDDSNDEVEQRPLAETAADSASAPDLGIATRQGDPVICRLCNIACSRRQAGVVHLVKIHGLERDFALALAKAARRAALTYKNGYTCHVRARTLSGWDYSWSTWPRTLRMWCQLTWNVQKGPGKKTRAMTETRSSAPGARRSIQHTRGCGSTCYRSTRRSSYREEAKRLKMLS